MTIEEKNEKIEAIDKLQNQYYMDESLNDEQKQARGIITFLEKDNITYDWSVYCLLNSEVDESYSLKQASKVYDEKLNNIKSTLASILGMKKSELSNIKISIDGIADDIINIRPKTANELKTLKMKIFNKISQMYKDKILDDITLQLLIAVTLELYNFYENENEIPFEQYHDLSKSK